MFERPQSGERAVLVHIEFSDESQKEELSEFKELATSAGVEVAAVVTGRLHHPHPKFFVGTGKVEEIKSTVKERGADVVLFNHALSPAQERNLERALECRVLDRTGLILDIFAQRARSRDGRLQVELAQLRHISTRLVRGWTHLERQKGGIGLRGPGETQLETDRRLIGERIKQLRKHLEKVNTRRQQGRRSRQRADVPTVSLVGYTNAGKSTLFNALSASTVYAADQLFATLDPTLRRVALEDADPVILADTVGFIRHLPHQLVAAFQSTLEETREADLLLHVVDAADPRFRENMEQVQTVLKEIGADAVRQIEIFNKIDLLEDVPPRIDRDEQGNAIRIWVSAARNQGMDLIRTVLTEVLRCQAVHVLIQLPLDAGRLRARLFHLGNVLAERTIDNGFLELEVTMEQKTWQLLEKDKEFSALTITHCDGKCLAGAA